MLLSLWLLCAFISAAVGSQTGQPVAGFVLGLVLGPIGIVATYLTGARCPECRSRVHTEATTCPRCQVRFEADNALDEEDDYDEAPVRHSRPLVRRGHRPLHPRRR